MSAVRARRAVSGSRKTTNAHPGGGGRSVRSPTRRRIRRQPAKVLLSLGHRSDPVFEDVHPARDVRVLLPGAEQQRRRRGSGRRSLRRRPGGPRLARPIRRDGSTFEGSRAPAAAGRLPISPFPSRRRQPRARPREPSPRLRLRAVPRDHHAVHAPGEPEFQRSLQPRGIVGDGSGQSSQEYRGARDGRHELRAGVSHAHEGDGDLVRDPLHAHDRHRGRQHHRPQVRRAVRQVVDGGPGEEIRLVELAAVRVASQVHRERQEDPQPRDARAEERAKDESLDDEVIASVRAASARHLVAGGVPHPAQLRTTSGHPHPPSSPPVDPAAARAAEAAATGPARDVREVIQPPKEPQEHERHREHRVKLERVPQRSQDEVRYRGRLRWRGKRRSGRRVLSRGPIATAARRSQQNPQRVRRDTHRRPRPTAMSLRTTPKLTVLTRARSGQASDLEFQTGVDRRGTLTGRGGGCQRFGGRTWVGCSRMWTSR